MTCDWTVGLLMHILELMNTLSYTMRGSSFILPYLLLGGDGHVGRAVLYLDYKPILESH